jgi:hypothetical protein
MRCVEVNGLGFFLLEESDCCCCCCVTSLVSSALCDRDEDRDEFDEDEDEEAVGDVDADEVVENDRIDSAAITEEEDAEDDRDTVEEGAFFVDALDSGASSAFGVLTAESFSSILASVLNLALFTGKLTVIDEADDREDEFDEEEVDVVEDEVDEESSVIRILLELFPSLNSEFNPPACFLS